MEGEEVRMACEEVSYLFQSIIPHFIIFWEPETFTAS